ncbi:MAG: lipoate--protein ligase family protein [Bacillus subtilis]|nr:lipoate--protein ligase family protein [Bacillus subtilis]
MKTIRSQSMDPTFNLAMEEYWLKHAVLDDDLFYLWRNNPAIVIGRNQNPYREIALWKAYQDQVPVIRRISGGGTVYHDPGNVNFTFVTSNFKGNINNYKAFLDPIEKALNQMGIPVRFQAQKRLVSRRKEGLRKRAVLSPKPIDSPRHVVVRCRLVQTKRLSPWQNS